MVNERSDAPAPAEVAPRPRGPEDVTAAVVDAATRLIGERGPGKVSLRDIAREARVNYGLIHYYFGTKDDVLRTVFRSLSYRVADRLATADTIWEMMDEYWQVSESGNSYVRMLSGLLLEGRDPEEFLGRSPAIGELRRGIEAAQAAPGPPPSPVAAPQSGEPFDPRLVAAATILVSMGWRLFSPFLISAAGLQDRTYEDLHRELGELVRLMIDAASRGRA